jgi:phage-related holin
MDKPITFTFWLATFIAPFVGIAMTLLLLVVANLVTSAYASYVKMETVSLSKIKLEAIKIAAYLLIVLATHLLESYVFTQVPMVKIAVGFMIVAELQSIAKNYQKIYGIHPFKAFMNLFDRLLRKKSTKPSSEETDTKN